VGNSLLIRNLAEGVKTELRVRAARNGRSMEEEARLILAAALARPSRLDPDGLPWSLGETARLFFGPENGIDLDLPPREPMREPPDFGWVLELEDHEAAEETGPGRAASDP
jgi:antitoxin FitA